jgi:pyruvate formate-lyase activating enzyme-like uncharacterized protein
VPYLWVYTNGLLAEGERLEMLADLGVDEVRFDMAATGYDHPEVLKNLEVAIRTFQVAVEVPAIPAHADKLLSCLNLWSDLGVRYLNLHELLYEPGSNSACLNGVRHKVVLPDGHVSAINPESRALTLACMEYVQAHGLTMAVNDCSLQTKLRQLRGRRRCLAPLTQAPHETLVDGLLLESYCHYQEGAPVRFIRGSALAEARRQHPEHQFARMARIAPLSINDPGRWVAFELLD